MKRQSAISAFFRPFDKRIRDSENENESDVRSGSPVDSNPSDQASTSRNQEVARNEESSNNNPTLPVQVDINTLPNKLPTHEGRSLQREWFTDFSWLRYNDDGTCHCSSCFWAITSNRLSRKYTEGIQNSKWVKTVDGWQDYRKGKSALQIHGRSSCHLAASNALQVRKTVFFFYLSFL